MIKKTHISILISVLFSSHLYASDQKLIFFKDFTHYKEKTVIDLDDKTYIELSDTAVLDTINIQVFNAKNERISLKNIDVMEQSESNIFTVNKNSPVFINDKEYVLISNGGDFIKVLDGEKTMYIPKNKIENLSFEKDINGNNHIVKVTGFKPTPNATLEYSYTFGNINWKPKYNLSLLEDNIALLDYNIQIDNNTTRNFKDVEIKFISEPIQRFYSNFSSSSNDSIFESKKEIPTPYNQPSIRYSNMNQDVMSKSMMVASEANIVSHDIESGKRVINFEGKFDIPANTNSSFSYLIGKEFKYIKHNDFSMTYYLKNDNQKKLSSPNLNIHIDRKEAQYHIPLSAGIVRVFSGYNTYENQLIKEDSISDKQDNDNLYFNLGKNYNINIDSYEKKDNISMSQSFTLKGSAYNENIKRHEATPLNYINQEKISLNVVSFNIDTKEISHNEDLKINLNGRQYLTTDRELAEHLVKNIVEHKNYPFGKKDDARKEYSEFSDLLKNKLQRTFTYSEKDLKSNKSTIFYLFTF